MSNKKPNPKRKPATEADVRKARREGVDFGSDMALVIMLTVLKDKHAIGLDDLHQIWKEAEDLSDSIAQGYVSLKDLRQVLLEEYNIVI